MNEIINLREKFDSFNEYWTPKIVGELNGQDIRLVKLKGEFVWHQHVNEDELFFVVEGILKIAFRDKIVEIHKNEFLVVPRGTEHKPIADQEVWVMLFEPSTTLNTGSTENEFTQRNLEFL